MPEGRHGIGGEVAEAFDGLADADFLLAVGVLARIVFPETDVVPQRLGITHGEQDVEGHGLAGAADVFDHFRLAECEVAARQCAEIPVPVVSMKTGAVQASRPDFESVTMVVSPALFEGGGDAGVVLENDPRLRADLFQDELECLRIVGERGGVGWSWHRVHRAFPSAPPRYPACRNRESNRANRKSTPLQGSRATRTGAPLPRTGRRRWRRKPRPDPAPQTITSASAFRGRSLAGSVKTPGLARAAVSARAEIARLAEPRAAAAIKLRRDGCMGFVGWVDGTNMEKRASSC